MNVLFLDDDPSRQRTFRSAVPHAVITTEAAECIYELLRQRDTWDFVFLDHDLGGNIFVDSNLANTGAEVARWIAKHLPKINMIIIHSYNSPGAAVMTRTLREAGYQTEYLPFGKETLTRAYQYERE